MILTISIDLALQRLIPSLTGEAKERAARLHITIQAYLDETELCAEGMSEWVALMEPFAAAATNPLAQDIPEDAKLRIIHGVRVGMGMLRNMTPRLNQLSEQMTL